MKEIDDVRKYSPLEWEVRAMKRSKSVTYWEVWQGLPHLQFQPAESRAGLDSLSYQEGRVDIWVPHNALEAHQEDPQTIYLAMIDRPLLIATNKYRVILLAPQTGTLEEAIRKAQEINKWNREEEK